MMMIIILIIIMMMIIILVSEALFCLCRGTNIYNFWGVTEFQDTYHGFLYFLSFLVFSLWILYIAGVRETQGDAL